MLEGPLAGSNGTGVAGEVRGASPVGARAGDPPSKPTCWATEFTKQHYIEPDETVNPVTAEILEELAPKGRQADS